MEMDIGSAFKTEVFRPIAILVIPGAIATFPYFMLAADRYPGLAMYREQHEIPYYAISLLIVLAIGLIQEDFGSLIEANLWDRLLERRYEVSRIWDLYLRLNLEKEPIGQRYIRTILLRMKIELSCAMSFIPFLVGLHWLNRDRPLFSTCAYWKIFALIAVLGIYLLFESYRGAKVLARTRRLILGLEPTATAAIK